MNIYNAIN